MKPPPAPHSFSGSGARLAANASTLSTLVPKAAASLAQAHPGLQLSLLDRHPFEALRMLRHGEIDTEAAAGLPGSP